MLAQFEIDTQREAFIDATGINVPFSEIAEKDIWLNPEHPANWELDEPPTRRERQATFADHAIVLAAVGMCVMWALAAVQGIVTWVWG